MSVLFLFSMFGLMMFLSQAEGPFGLMSWARNKLFSHTFIGPFFYQLFECPLCLGTWAGFGTYVLTSDECSFGMFLAYGFAGGGFCYLVKQLVDYVHKE